MNGTQYNNDHCDQCIILSLDGGGSRGLFTVEVLVQLEKDINELVKAKTRKSFKYIHLNDLFDILIGTSTGAIITAGLATPIPIGEMLNFYNENLQKIFYSSWWTKFVTLGGLIGSHLSNKVLVEKFTNFEKYLLSNIDESKQLLMTVYDLGSNCTVLFDSNKARTDSSQNYKLNDAVLATTAEFVFNPVTIQNQAKQYKKFADIGTAINPAMLSIPEAIKFLRKKGMNSSEIYDPTNKKIKIISIGTGIFKSNFSKDAKDYGILHWIIPTMYSVWNDQIETTTKEIDKIEYVEQHRLQVYFDKNISSIDASDETLQMLRCEAIKMTKSEEYKKVLEILTEVAEQKFIN